MFDLPEETTVSKEKQNIGNSPLTKVLKPPEHIKTVSYTFVILHTTVTMLLAFVLCGKTKSPTTTLPPQKKPPPNKRTLTKQQPTIIFSSLAWLVMKVLFRLIDTH